MIGIDEVDTAEFVLDQYRPWVQLWRRVIFFDFHHRGRTGFANDCGRLFVRRRHFIQEKRNNQRISRERKSRHQQMDREWREGESSTHARARPYSSLHRTKGERERERERNRYKKKVSTSLSSAAKDFSKRDTIKRSDSNTRAQMDTRHSP